MATTAQDILTAAFAKSTKNIPSQLVSQATELCSIVTRSMRALFAVGARVNPTVLAKTASVAFATPGWPQPADAESVFRLELPSGAETVLVPFDQRNAEPGKPAVFVFGQVYRPAGNALDPVSGNLVLYYSKRPAALAVLTDALDALWPEAYNELLALDVAVALALRDGRDDELPTLKEERTRWLQLFVAWLEHVNASERRLYGATRYVNSNTLVSLSSLLSGEKAA